MWSSITRCANVYALLLAACASIHAAPALSAEGKSITLDEAIDKTLERNPRLLAFGYQLNVKRGRVQQAGLPPNPELFVTVEDALGTGEYRGFSSSETTVSLGWAFERAVRESRINAAQAGESLTAADIEILRIDIAAETALRFLTLLANQARAVTMKEGVDLAELTIKAVERRVEAGRSPQADLARAQTELAFAVLAQEDIRHEIRAARHRLAAQWGTTEPDFEEVSGNPYSLPSTLPLEELKLQAEQNPQMKRYLTKQRLDEAELRLAEAQRKPGWRGVVGVRRYASTDDFALVTGATIPLPLRNHNQGNIAEAHAVAEQTVAEMAAAKVHIETTLYVFYEALQHSLHRANTLSNEVLPRLESALAETQAAYELGRYSYFDWRAVQADLIEAQNALIDASVDAHRNIIEIERLTGIRVAQTGIAQ
ncbi:MAG: TolC family protein [Xanthomonadales bacterium]|nr:TolC family protein [Xanthomonadales bacterium]